MIFYLASKAKTSELYNDMTDFTDFTCKNTYIRTYILMQVGIFIHKQLYVHTVSIYTCTFIHN